MLLFKHLAALMLIAAVLTACGGKEERKAKYLERGKAYLEEGNFDKARIEFKNVAQIDPKSGEAFLYLGRVEEKEEAWAKAFRNYRRAVELDPSLIDPRVTMAKLYLAQAASYGTQGNDEDKKYTQDLAKEQINMVLEKAPDNLEGLTLQASLWSEAGDTKKAVDQLRRILSTNPDVTSASIFLSAIYAKEDNSDEAIQVLLEALPNADDPANLRGRLVQLYLAANKRDQAEGVIRQLIENNPDVLRYRASLATFMVEEDRVDDAEQILRDTIAADPTDASRYLLLSDFQLNKRSPEIAIKELEIATKEHPELTDLRFGLITLYSANNQLDQVHDLLESIIAEQDLEPIGLRARVSLAQLLASENQEEDRVNTLLSEVITENPQDSSALMLRGQIAGKGERWVDAINDFRSVLRSEPSSLRALRLLASAHLANNEEVLAKDTLKTALDLSPMDVSMRLQLASLLADEENYDQALTQINFILDIDAENQQALNSKFNLLALKGDADGMSAVAKTLQAAVPDSEGGFIREARLLFVQKKYEESMSMAEEIIKKNPSSTLGYLLRSDIHLAKKEYGDALDAAQKLKELQPENAIGPYREAKILIVKKDMAGAISAYQEALKKAPSSTEILSGLSMLQIREGELTVAIKHLQSILSEDADHPVANVLLGRAYIEAKEYPKAEKVFSRQIEINPNSITAYAQLASVRIAQDNEGGAMDAYQAGIEIAPDNAGLLLGIAGLKERLKEFESAIGYYEKLLEKQPNSALGINNLTALLSDHRSDAESMSKVTEYAKILEQAEQPVFKDTAAWAYYKAGDTAKALELANQVTEEMPDVSIFNYHLGMIHIKNGDLSMARKYLSKAVSAGNFDGIDSARSALEKL